MPQQLPFNVALIAALIKILAVVGFIMLTVPMLVWLERKVIADIQARIGPNRVGKFGLLQAFADGIKLLFKESILPAEIDRLLYFTAPIVVLIPAMAVAAVMPFAGALDIGGYRHQMVIADVPVAVLWVLAVTSLGVYGVVLAGWSSNNKYSLLGGLRAAAQMVSYELPMGLSVVVALMIASHVTTHGVFTLSLRQVVDAQHGGMMYWTAFNWKFGFIGFLAALIFYTCGLAETNRSPFDLPEAESELIGGYHTEYAGMRFALFFLAEYAAMLNIGAMTATLFFGGWRAPYRDTLLFAVGSAGYMLQGLFWFGLKVYLIIIVYIWLRGTLPRLRYDRLMDFGWKVLIPVSLGMVMFVATLLTIFFPVKAPAALLEAPKVETPGQPPGLPPGHPGTNLPGGLLPGNLGNLGNLGTPRQTRPPKPAPAPKPAGGR